MLTPTQVYPIALAFVETMRPTTHRATRTLHAKLLTALLVGQRLQPAMLVRSLPVPAKVGARPRFKTVHGGLTSPGLAATTLTPDLIRAVLPLIAYDPTAHAPDGAVELLLDTVRCGNKETVVVGLRWHGRILPLAWRTIAYPWPKHTIHQTVLAVIAQVAAHWPPTVPVHLVADRFFPKGTLFQFLAACGWDWTVRCTVRHFVTDADGTFAQVRDRLPTKRDALPTSTPVRFGGARGPAMHLVMIPVWPVVPKHQATPGSLRHRTAQHAERDRHDRTRSRTSQPSYNASWLLLTSVPSVRRAHGHYRRRWGIEGTFRDFQSGWDGYHGWGFEPLAAAASTLSEVDHLVGLMALASVLVLWLGQQVGIAEGDDLWVVAQHRWTTTGRLSIWARGVLALRDPQGDLDARVQECLEAAVARIAASLEQRPVVPALAA